MKLEASAEVLSLKLLRKYVAAFNAVDDELYIQAVPNHDAADFLARNIPLFECPDVNIERTYYFRWWTYRKHIKQTPHGTIITEFLPNVPWASNYNAITCPGTHHFREGRWLADPIYLREYAEFWINHSGRHPSPMWKGMRTVLGHGFPLSDAFLQFHRVHPSNEQVMKLLPDLTANYEELKAQRSTETGLYWSRDCGWLGDGMEEAIGGPGIRPTFNSYMYAQCRALAEMHAVKKNDKLSKEYADEAEAIRVRMTGLLWDDEAKFFKVMRTKDEPLRKLADVREQIGYIPWIYSIPPKDSGYEEAWRELMSPDGFYAPYGPTTAEQRHPAFSVSYQGHECQWNGPSWPYATAQTLTAMANVLQEYPQNIITKRDYIDLLDIYTRCHQLQREDGSLVPWIDENLNPYTGDWLARTRLKSWRDGTWADEKGGQERGKDYNHSTYVDLIITGLVGLRPRSDYIVEVNPLVPDNTWDYFCLDRVPYKGRRLTIIWDKTGERYSKGKGLTILADGEVIAHSTSLSRTDGRLN